MFSGDTTGMVQMGFPLPNLKRILMGHYDSSVNSTLDTPIGNDEINESNKYTQIATVKICKNYSFSEVDLIVQSNTLNKASNKFAMDKMYETAPYQSLNTPAIAEYDELHIINILKVAEVKLMNDTTGSLCKHFYLIKNETIENWINFCANQNGKIESVMKSVEYFETFCNCSFQCVKL